MDIVAMVFSTQSIHLVTKTVQNGAKTVQKVCKKESIMQKRKFEIITDNPEEMARELMDSLHHGVTEIRVVGKYSHTDKSMIVCIIRKKQIGQMMKIIKKYKGTFASFSKVNEVFGRFRK